MNIFNRLYWKAVKLLELPNDLLRKVNSIQQSLGRLEALMAKDLPLTDSEFKVYSQWGEDGIIQYLINNVEIKDRIFIEFGVENYKESNTRFLLTNNNWAGLIMDGDIKNIDRIRKDEIYWRYNLKSAAIFINRENINDIITQNGISGDIGLLSVDIDGNDYWIWEAINVINPRIVICEYNSLFGPDAVVSTPYDKDYIRGEKHFSYVYYGASISALNYLAEKKGYSLVHGNSNGNNVFFVRNDVMGDLVKKSPGDVYKKASFRDSREVTGDLNFLSFEERVTLIKDLDVFDVTSNQIRKIEEIV